jgi:hypothetical protein
MKNYSEIYIDITVNWTSRMQDLLPFLGPQRFQNVPGKNASDSLIIELEVESRSRVPSPPNFPGRPWVLCSFNINCSLFCGNKIIRYDCSEISRTCLPLTFGPPMDKNEYKNSR